MTSRLIPIFCIVLLALSFVSAEQYWSVVYDDAPASDVVNAANFAASMKASAGVSFSGKLASEVKTELSQTSEPVMRVILDGEDATVIADQTEFSRVIPVIRQYLINEGFDVEFTTPEKAATEEPRGCCLAMTASCLACSLDLSVEEYCALYPDTIDCPNPCAATLCPVPSTCEVINGEAVCIEEEPAQEELPDEEEIFVPPVDVPQPQKRPNVFLRAWLWFVGVFS